PSQVSSGSHASPEPVRQTEPALPAGCWHADELPSHSSTVHGLPSVEQAVLAGEIASAGQLALVPGHCSAGSHSPEEARHMVVAGSKASGGHVVLVPVQVSATSHTPALPRHIVPALPAVCWQSSLAPSHSSSVQGFASPEHAVPAGTLSSAGQAGPVPGQLSA